jgi:hypothetical protein
MIDFCYIINLTQDFDQLCRKFLDNCRQVGEEFKIPYFVVNAPNGRKITSYEESVPFPWAIYQSWQQETPPNIRWEKWVQPGELGCSLSHYWVWKNALEEQRGNTLILEEDFYFLNWPSQEEWDSVPDDWDVIFLGRQRRSKDGDEEINEHVCRVGYSAQTHGYLVSPKGQQKLLDAGLNENIIPVDEFIMGVCGLHPREDINELFQTPDFNAYAFGNKSYIQQGSSILSSEIVLPSPVKDVRNWDAWAEKYINPNFKNKDFRKILEDLDTQGGLLQVPLFTQAFCDDVIELIERTESIIDNPNNPFPVIQAPEIGFDFIFHKVTLEYFVPFTTWYWQPNTSYRPMVQKTFLSRIEETKEFDYPRLMDFGYRMGVRLTDSEEGLNESEFVFPSKPGNVIVHPTLLPKSEDGKKIVFDSKFEIISYF